MLQLDARLKIVIHVVLVLAVFCAAALLGGCGRSEQAVSSAPPPPPAAEHTAAAGPAIDVELSIDQLALDSSIAHVKDKNGLEFLEFKYTDNDGKVYKCVLPAAMAEGKHKPSEWLTTFNVYRLPEVLAQKKVNRPANENLGDFPFISPKPAEAPKTEPENPKPNIVVPSMPTSPSAPNPQATPSPESG